MMQRSRYFITRKRSGFSLIELMVSIAIIGLLLGLLVLNTHRQLGQNVIVDDAEIFSSKVEEMRLVAASYQQADSTENTEYYGAYVPNQSKGNYFLLVRLSKDLNASGPGHCTAQDVIDQLSTKADCIIDKISFSSGVQLINPSDDRFILFRTPTQQAVKLVESNNQWQAADPTFGGQVFFRLTLGAKQATVKLNDYTARVGVSY